ncbi:MAG: tetratricopeptide repeat protein, partial [candidate division Zixibacteria bacterium]
SHEATAAANRLAVLHFDNIVDPDDSLGLGPVLSNLLATDLSESKYVQVVSPSRIRSIYNLLEDRNFSGTDSDLLTEVAKRSHSRYLLTGSIVQTEPRMILTAQVTELLTERSISSLRVIGNPGETVFPLIDQLTVRVKAALELPAEASNEPDQQIADVTTKSQEAYYHYVKGLDLSSRFLSPEAVKEYEKAIEFDSTFAMAWFGLSKTRGKFYLDKAFEYSQNASEKEKKQILIAKATREGDIALAKSELFEIINKFPDETDALFSLGNLALNARDLDSAIYWLNRTIASDSLYKLAYNLIAYTYERNGNLEMAIQSINGYCSIAPEEPNPQDSKGEIYAINGRLDEAIAAFGEALRIDPAFYPSAWNLAHMMLFKEEYDSATAIYQQTARSEHARVRAMGRTYLTLPAVYQGRFEKAHEQLDDGIGADRIEGRVGEELLKHLVKASIYEETGQLAKALNETKIASDLRGTIPTSSMGIELIHRALLLADNDSLSAARDISEELKTYSGRDKYISVGHLLVDGAIAQAEGDLDSAVAKLHMAMDDAYAFDLYYRLGQIYMAAGDYEHAALKFEHIVNNYNAFRATWAVRSVKSHYFLAQAYEALERTDDAITQYKTYLRIYDNADRDLDAITDARKRLTSLISAL